MVVDCRFQYFGLRACGVKLQTKARPKEVLNTSTTQVRTPEAVSAATHRCRGGGSQGVSSTLCGCPLTHESLKQVQAVKTCHTPCLQDVLSPACSSAPQAPEPSEGLMAGFGISAASGGSWGFLGLGGIWFTGPKSNCIGPNVTNQRQSDDLLESVSASTLKS